MSENTTSEALPTDFENAFDDWIGGATISKRSVLIYGKPGLFADFEQLEREHNVASEIEKHEKSLGGTELAAIEVKMQTLYDEWQASKSTWVVRALDADQFEELRAQFDAPDEPVEPAKGADDAAKAAYAKAVKAYERETIRIANELNLAIIAKAVTRIEFANGKSADSISVEQLRTMGKRLGERQLLSLINASQLAMYQEPEIPAFFSRDSSEEDLT